MSQTCTLAEPSLPFLRFNPDAVTLDQLVNFLFDHDVTVAANADAVALIFPTENENVQEVIELEDEDHIVIMAGEVEVFTEAGFHEHFNVG